MGYQEAIDTAPPEHKEVAVFHSNKAACHFMLDEFEQTVNECDLSLKLDSSYVKALKRRAKSNEKLDKPDLALEDWKKVVEIAPQDKESRVAVVRVEPLAQAKFERDKEEMMGKLKDLGNSFLGMFGMSVDNFEMKQDPANGSYSIGMKN